MSSAMPTSAMKIVAQNSTTGAERPSTTAQVPLNRQRCGDHRDAGALRVGMRCDERAFGRASA